MSTSVHCILPPLLTSSPADSPQNDDSILSQRVHGELVVLISLWKSESEESFCLHRSYRLSQALQNTCEQKSCRQWEGSP